VTRSMTRAPSCARRCTTRRTTTTPSGTANSWCFGDGDGKVFGLFTRPIDVLGHEFTGEVVAVGRTPSQLGVLSAGDRVVLNPVQACHACV